MRHRTKQVPGDPKRVEEIYEALNKAFKILTDAKIDIGGCGCCGSPFITSEVDGESSFDDAWIADKDEDIRKMAEEMASRTVTMGEPYFSPNDQAIQELDNILKPIEKPDWLR